MHGSRTLLFLPERNRPPCCYAGGEYDKRGKNKTPFPKSAPARFGCMQRKACNNTGVGYSGAVSARSGGTPVRTVRAEIACLSLGPVRSGAPLLKDPSSTELWFPGSNWRSTQHLKIVCLPVLLCLLSVVLLFRVLACPCAESEITHLSVWRSLSCPGIKQAIRALLTSQLVLTLGFGVFCCLSLSLGLALTPPTPHPWGVHQRKGS